MSPSCRRRRPTCVALGLALLFFVFAVLPLGAEDRERSRVSDLTVAESEDQLVASFRLLYGFTDDTLARIQSGLPTGFTYSVVLERPRSWWFDKRIDRTSIEVVAMYNAITREYLVNFKQDGRLVDSRVVSSPSELEQAMTIFHAWPMFELEERDYRNVTVRLRAELGSRTILALIPTTVHTRWAETDRFHLDGGTAEDELAIRAASGD